MPMKEFILNWFPLIRKSHFPFKIFKDFLTILVNINAKLNALFFVTYYSALLREAIFSFEERRGVGA